jgi:uncharacterized OB-fold protein
MKECEDCGQKFEGIGDQCPACKAKERLTDMAVGDKGR